MDLGLSIIGFIVAVRIILRNWKSPHRPEFTEWLKLMTETAAFENMIARVNNVQTKTSQIWQRFLAYIKGAVS